MTSNGPYEEAFVWIWLPGETAPVVASKLTAAGDRLLFHYGKSYPARNNAIALYEPELPLQAGLIPLLPGLSMPSCIRDGSPDAWGRRVIINRKLGRAGAKADSDQLDELAYLLESGSDPEVSPQNPPSGSVGKEGVVLIGDPLIGRSDPAD